MKNKKKQKKTHAPIVESRLKFTRRPDINEWDRMELALAMRFRRSNYWGLVSELANRFNVSRQFLYDNFNMCSEIIGQWFRQYIPEPNDDFLLRLILCLRLYCHSSISGISVTLGELGISPNSAGYVSETLKQFGATCPVRIPKDLEPITIMLDETFAGSRPILVAMEAVSHYLLAIELADDRKAETWEAHLHRLQSNGVEILLAVKDQGSAMKAATAALGIPERVDLFHLLKPFDPFLGSRERHAYGAIEAEVNAEAVFYNRKSPEAIEKYFSKYEQARQIAAKAIDDFDAYDYLHRCLHEAFDSFTTNGRLRTRNEASGDVEAVLELISEQFGSTAKIRQALKFIRGNLCDYWGYFEQLESIISEYLQVIPEYTLRTACLAWQLGKKAIALKNHAAATRLQSLSGEYLQLSLNGIPESMSNDIKKLLKALDGNIRSSSPLEAINSIIRQSLNSCRGQISQETLNLLAFHINHKRATRGKYAGTSAYERLTGQRCDASDIDLLLARAAKSGEYVPEMMSGRFAKAA